MLRGKSEERSGKSEQGRVMREEWGVKSDEGRVMREEERGQC